MELLAAVIVFALVIAGMAVGVIFMKKPISGSCGGLNNLEGSGGKCDICGATADDPNRCPPEIKERAAKASNLS